MRLRTYRVAQGVLAPHAKVLVQGLSTLLAALAIAASCSPSDGEPGEPPAEHVGSVQLAATLPPGFQENAVITGRTAPVALRFTPPAAGPMAAFLAEKGGRVFAFPDIDNQSNPQQVIDLRSAVHDYWDRGLLGIAVHPNYPATSQIFVLYTHDAFANGSGPRWGDTCPDPPGATSDGCVVYGRLSRIDVNPTTLVGTEVPLIEANWCQQYPSHSIGDLQFGTDGYLYLSSGDGASFTFNDVGQDGNPVNPCGDPGNVNDPNNSQGGRLRSQDVLTNGDPIGYNGSILRLDVSGGTVSAPATNPLVGKGTTADDYIVATGLRNPYRFAVRPGTNELWIADVGQNTWEELNRLPDPLGTVENFGFPCYEGPDAQSYLANNVLCTQVYTNTYPAHVSPMATVQAYYRYHHFDSVAAGDGCRTGSSSITGVAFNNSSAYPSEYDDALFFADSSRGCVWTMFRGSNGLPDPNNRAVFIRNTSGRVVDVQMGPDGRLYYVDFDGGAVYRIDSFSGNEPPQAAISATPTAGSPPLAVTFDASASTDEEDPNDLDFAWDFDDDGSFDDATGVSPSHVFTSPGIATVRLRVTDPDGESDEASLHITVGNNPPAVTILTPSPSLRWAVGDTISFSGQAVDPETGPLPASRLAWSVVLQHCQFGDDCHAHPIETLEGVASGSFSAPDHDYPSHLELTLSAADSGSWFDPSWLFRRPLTLDHSDLTGEQNFPVLVRLDATRINYGAVQAGGRDLRFVDESGTVLPHEVELWNPSGTSTIWVKVPAVPTNSTDRQVMMYYGNASAPEAQNSAGVWSNGYVAVWHLGNLEDSTAFGHDGTNSGTTVVAGDFGNARNFNGSSNINVGTASGLEVTGSLTIEAWARPSTDNLAGFPRILSKKTHWNSEPGYGLELTPSQETFQLLAGGDNFLRGTTTVDAQYRYYAATLTGATGATYKDGVNVTTDSSAGALTASSEPLLIGSGRSTDYLTGVIDELRISNVARSSNWVALQYRSLADEYLSFGAEEDSAILGASTSIVLQPQVSEVTFRSQPPGAQIQVGDVTLTTPAEPETVIENSGVSVSVLSPQIIGGVEYEFANWSDGGARAHVYTVNGDATLTVTFEAAGTVTDSDADGLPDAWETQYGLDPGDPDDAVGDNDDDHLDNLEEYAEGTDPTDADSDGDTFDDFTEVTFGGDPLDEDVLPNPPVVSIAAPSSGAVIVGTEVVVAFTTTGSPLAGDHMHLQLDALPPVMVMSTSGSRTFTGVAPGTHTITAHIASGSHQEYEHAGSSRSVTFTVQPPGGTGAKLEVAQAVVGGSWQTIALDQAYESPVVVSTLRYSTNTIPVVTRVRNVTSNSFQIKLQNPSGSAVNAGTVQYIVMEEGSWTVDGVKCEAQRYTSTVTDSDVSMVGQVQAYGHAFVAPVVVGQVMSANDTRFSAFWSRGSTITMPPSPTALTTGKLVGEDPITTRANEEIGFIVFERGHGSIGGVEFEAAVSPNIVIGPPAGSTPQFAFITPFAAPPQLGVFSQTGRRGGDGSWAQQQGATPFTATQARLSIDEDQLSDTERNHTEERVAYVVFEEPFTYDGPSSCPAGCDDADPCTEDACEASGNCAHTPIPGCSGAARMEIDDVVADGDWQTVPLQQTYVSPVVVSTLKFANSAVPLVTRIRNVTEDSFDIRVKSPSTATAIPEVVVQYLVVEQGVWTWNGHRVEAQRYLSTVTDNAVSYVGEARTFGQTYVEPVVVGQVMSTNDPDFSVFWSRGAKKSSPASPTALFTGKSVGEDPDTSRAHEEVGFVIFEAGHGTIGGVEFEAEVGPASVRGATQAAPYNYSFLTPFSGVPQVAVVSQAGQSGGNGSWAQLHGSSPFTNQRISLSLDEDEIGDIERQHTEERVSYVVFREPFAYAE